VAGAGGYFLQVRRAIPWSEVVGLQRHAGVVFTSSLADGMNLVPLQAAVAQSLRPTAERAVVLVGRDAGAAHAYPGFEQDGLVTVDPFDEASTAATLAAAVERRIPGVSDRLIGAVRHHSAASWATAFLSTLESAAC
jgi:trehalose-6-phosphate synthase